MRASRPGPDRHPDIVWLLVDSIRSRPTPGDLRGKLPFMERFGKESVEFTTCVTTAPSTIMSITAMMTGLPAYFLARNYDDFRFDGGYGHSLSAVLKAHGYSSWAFLRGMETREKFRTFLDPVPRRLWPGDLKHGQKWRNADLDRLLDRVLESEVPRPAFLFFHYNPQTQVESDPRISERVEATWERLVAAGFTPDRTIYVLCSDHGYPAPETGITSEWEAENRLTHDLVLTDDNILIPLSIRYPGCRPRTIDTPVSSLDLFPTLLELAGIPSRERIEDSIDGESLVPLIESGGSEDAYGRRFFRCDSRLMLQTARSTAIRGRRFKYLRSHDEYRLAAGAATQPDAEALFDLEEDPSEGWNLLARGDPGPELRDVLGELRSEFERSERRGLEFQIDYLLWKQRDKLSGKGGDGGSATAPRVLLAFEPGTAAYHKIGLGAIRRVHPNAEVDLVAGEADLGREPVGDGEARTFSYGPGPDGGLTVPDPRSEPGTTGEPRQYDLALLFVRDPGSPSVAALLRAVKKVPSRTRLVVDCNFNAYRRQGYWYYRFRALVDRLPYMLEEPGLVLSQLRTAVSVLKRRILTRLGRWERWDAAEAMSARGEEG